LRLFASHFDCLPVPIVVENALNSFEMWRRGDAKCYGEPIVLPLKKGAPEAAEEKGENADKLVGKLKT